MLIYVCCLSVVLCHRRILFVSLFQYFVPLFTLSVNTALVFYAGVPISYKYSGAKPISFDQSTEKGSSLN